MFKINRNTYTFKNLYFLIIYINCSCVVCQTEALLTEYEMEVFGVIEFHSQAERLDRFLQGRSDPTSEFFCEEDDQPNQIDPFPGTVP